MVGWVAQRNGITRSDRPRHEAMAVAKRKMDKSNGQTGHTEMIGGKGER